MSSFDALNVCNQNKVIYVRIKWFICMSISFMSYSKLSISEANDFYTFRHQIQISQQKKNIHPNFFEWMMILLRQGFTSIKMQRCMKISKRNVDGNRTYTLNFENNETYNNQKISVKEFQVTRSS